MDYQRLGTLLTFLFAIQTGNAYQFYQQRIPNGEFVPHPCKITKLWRGVGHHNMLGGGNRNQFGLDFKNNGAVWDDVICTMDSDNDGITNGEELGDPNCEWTPGQDPSRTTRLSHPGICEPLGSDKCGPIPEWINCKDEKDKECPAISEPETFNLTIRIPPTTVPPVETSLNCMYFEFPNDKEYHIVADGPYIDNKAVLHHILLFGCTSDISRDLPLNTLQSCDMNGGHPDCQDLIALWAVGLPFQCGNTKAGMMVGGGRGYRYAAMQVHWNNPELRGDYIDSSGLMLFLTPKLRTYNAGVLGVGQLNLEIPPGENSTAISGRCSSQCSRKIMSDTIYVYASGNHMHYLGKSAYGEVRRNGVRVAELDGDEVFHFDSPVSHVYENHIQIQPGDEIKTTCVFQSTSKTKTTYFGQETSSEMCFAVLRYYPKENVNDKACVTWGSIDMCELQTTGIARGCNFFSLLFNPSEPNEMKIRLAIEEKCATTHCTKECKDYVKVLKSTSPCYIGETYTLRKANIDGFGHLARQELSPEDLKYYSRVDSCDVELALESYIESERNEIGGAHQLAASFMTCSLVLFVKSIF